MRMPLECFGLDRIRPDGNWVRITPLLEVADIDRFPQAVSAFYKAVRKAERSGWPYGLRLKPDTGGTRLEVHGHAPVQPLFREAEVQSWHIGFVPDDHASDLLARVAAGGAEVELYSVFESPRFSEVAFFVLEPGVRLEAAAEKPSGEGERISTKSDYFAIETLVHRMTNAVGPEGHLFEAARKATIAYAVNILINNTATRGEATGALASSASPEAIAAAAEMDQDLQRRLKAVSSAFEHYLETGEIPPPDDAWRICVMLRGQNKPELERAFLSGWSLHFAGRAESEKHRALLERAGKIGAIPRSGT